MTDKERLEDIAHNVGVSLDGEKALMSSDDYDFLYNYALDQAERVQELEKENKRYREAIDYVMTAEATQYRSLENALEDIKFVINETLESDSDE